MSGNESPPSDQVNWEAYSHEELHRMLWQEADVADVSTVADEWTRHRAALSTHAEVLREQRTALLGDWHGKAAEEAASRLGALADRIEKISELASAGQRAAQDAADALATARATMPPPPTAPPFELPTTPAFVSLPTAPTFAPAPSFMSLPTMPATFNPATFNPAAFNPGAGGAGFSFYFGVAGADQQKAQAVRAMQAYESSLNGSSKLIDDARGAVPQAAPPPTRAAATAGGVPWQRLVGGGGGGRGAAAAMRSMGPVIGAPAGTLSNTAGQLTPGGRAGVMFGITGGPAVVSGPFGTDTSTRNVAQNGMMPPPGGGARGEDEQPHENQMPTLDHGLFDLDERAAPPVIGETSGVES